MLKSKEKGSELPSKNAEEKLYLENTLLRIFGVLFCHDPKRAATRTQDVVINEDRREKRIVVRLDSRYGQPGPLAHKVLLAILKKHSDYGRPVQNEISFGRRELIRLIGRNTIGGRDSEELVRALRQIRYTHTIAFFKSGDKFIEHDFNIFSEIMIERRASHNDPIVACTVRLANPIISSLRDEHFVCFNHSFMAPLGTIAQALYMRLFFHLANLYEVHRGKKGLEFKKRYDDICNEWLGGLSIADRISHIKRDQLGRHLDQLIDGKFLSSYSIEKAKTGSGFVLTFRPGGGFFADYERFYRHRNQGELQWKFHADQRDIAEPLKVAYLFIEKRNGQPVGGVPYVSTAETQHARNILSRIDLASVSAFLDFALGQARKTNYDPQSLAGIMKYLELFLAAQKRQRSAKAARAALAEEEDARNVFEAFRRSRAQELLSRLSSEEQATVERLAENDAAKFSGNPMMLEAARARIMIARHSTEFPTFEEWHREESRIA